MHILCVLYNLYKLYVYSIYTPSLLHMVVYTMYYYIVQGGQITLLEN